MNAAELAGLKVESLTDDQLEQAWSAAHKLDAEELAVSFARALTSRPPRPDKTDRFPLFAFLTQHALKTGQPDAALDFINEGERLDCEQNEGRRRNNYELRRGHVHAKRGEADAAADVFQRLIERVPDELKYRGSAAEAMLTLKQADRALRFAEDGLRWPDSAATAIRSSICKNWRKRRNVKRLGPRLGRTYSSVRALGLPIRKMISCVPTPNQSH